MRHRVHEEGSMLEIMRRLGTATSSLHRGMKDTVDAVGDAILDLCGNYGSRPRADRNRRRRAPHGLGYTGYHRRNSPAVVRRAGPKIRVIQISIRTAGGRPGEIKLMQRQNDG